jgi:hypothetical protein
MLINRTFVLACATVVTLSIAAASSTPAQAQPCSEKRTERERQECSIRSAIYSAVSQAESAVARAQQQPQHAAAARAKKQDATASLTKNKCSLVASQLRSEKGIRRQRREVH